MRMSERELERLAGRLGEGADRQLDVERMVESVTARLRVAGGAVTDRPVARWLAAAAGVALMVSAAWFTFSQDATQPTLGAGSALLPGIADLYRSELHEVLDSLTLAVPAGLDNRRTLDDLDAEQLATLLTMMEG